MSKFRVGPEVEHTAAYGTKTLYVGELTSVDNIIRQAAEYQARHIRFRINTVSVRNGVIAMNGGDSYQWVDIIEGLLSRQYTVSVDYPAENHALVLQAFGAGIWGNRSFIPVATVILPKLGETNVNFTLRVGDTEAHTNLGVWCLNHREVSDTNRLTEWGEYGHIKSVETVGAKTPTPTPTAKVKPPKQVIEPVAEVPTVEEPELVVESSDSVDGDTSNTSTKKKAKK